ncbi:MAG: substrate-binding domain-containing protein [Magnetococcales bacterium]|nr:substrate-binding domain-containing protein [Magnetococcales bacterium]
MKPSFFSLGLFAVFILLKMTQPGWSLPEEPEVLKGLAFSDPDAILEQTEEWKRQPIRHQESDRGVEVALLLDQNIHPGLRPLVEEFSRNHGIRVSVREGTCGPAAEGIRRKEVDIGGSCCPAGIMDRLPGLRWHTIGISPMAILVHASDPVESLPAATIRDIFRGTLTRWGQIPGVGEHFPRDSIIRPVTRLHCKTRPGHWRLILDNEDLFGPRVKEVGTILDMVISVANNHGSIGYLENWEIINDPKYRTSVRAIRVDDRDPHDPKAVASGKYPFYWVYNVSTWTSAATANPKAQELVRFLLAQAHRINPEHHVVPASELKKQGWKFKDDELIGAP